MFTHNIEGNTLYIRRPRAAIYTSNWLLLNMAIWCFALLVMFFAFYDKYEYGLTQYLAMVGLFIGNITFIWLYNRDIQKQKTIKFTLPQGENLVIVNNTIITAPRYIYNPATLKILRRKHYTIYLMQMNGDSHVIVNYIVEIDDMYAMMDIIAEYIAIPALRDN